MMLKVSPRKFFLQTCRVKLVLPLLAIAVFSPHRLGAQTPPRPDHIVIVVEENHSFEQLMDSSTAPYINNELIGKGALLTSFFARHHPSQPNYFVLFSGDRQDIKKDDCLELSQRIMARSLGGQLVRNGLTFKGYAEDMPEVGFTPCQSGKYVRKHAPWISFADVPTVVSLPFSEFPADFDKLPTVSMVIPNLDNDMHDPVLPIFAPSRRTRGDTWLKDRLGAYAKWAQTHNSLLIVTWDEDNDNILPPKTTTPPDNHIATIFYGQMVMPGIKSDKRYDHVDLLKTLLHMYCLPQLPTTKKASLITDIWRVPLADCPVTQ